MKPIKNHFKNVNINNDFIKLYIRLIKENDVYNEQYISIERYNTAIDNKKLKEKHTIKYILNIPDLFIDTTINYNLYLDIHKLYCKIISIPIIENLLKEIYQQLTDKQQKKIFLKCRRKIKNNIIVNYNKKLCNDRIDDSMENMLSKIISRELLTHNIKELTYTNIINLTHTKKQYKLFKKH